jgi:hypothetical protein
MHGGAGGADGGQASTPERLTWALLQMTVDTSKQPAYTHAIASARATDAYDGRCTDSGGGTAKGPGADAYAVQSPEALYDEASTPHPLRSPARAEGPVGPPEAPCRAMVVPHTAVGPWSYRTQQAATRSRDRRGSMGTPRQGAGALGRGGLWKRVRPPCQAPGASAPIGETANEEQRGAIRW